MNKPKSFFDWLHLRLTKELPGLEAQIKMMPTGRVLPKFIPETAKKSAVLLLLFPVNKDFQLVMIQRSFDGSVHSGQIAFPGGRVEDYDESIIETAKREANEEVNLDLSQVQVLGQLTPIFIPVSNFEVFPVVASVNEKPELLACDVEVAGIINFSFQEHFQKKEIIPVFSTGKLKDKMKAPAYLMNQEKFIWGATAMILAELEYLWIEFQEMEKG